MKVQSFLGAAALAVQFSSVFAVPANADYNDYAIQKEALKRGLKVVTRTETATVTDDTVVVVDQNGNIIRTERRTPITPVASSPIPPPTATTTAISQPVTRDPQTSAAPSGGNAGSGSLKGFSVAYDPIGANGCRSFDSDFALLAQQGVALIRVFDVGCNLGDAVTAAAKHNVKLMLGINDIQNGKLQTDLGKLISDVTSSSVKFAPVDTVYICNECVERGQSAGSVAAAVTSAKGTLKGAGFLGSVITVDTFGKIKDDTTICSTSDYCGANIHPFFNADFTSSQAGKFVKDSLDLTKATNQNVRLVITETGWPHGGQNNGQAVPSPQDQKTALASIMSTFANTPADVYLFQPFDASYKQPGAFGVEPFFGILNEQTGALSF